MSDLVHAASASDQPPSGQLSSEIIEHPAFDFSKYQPGDVIIIPDLEIVKMGMTNSILLAAAIANAATRAGLDWRTWREDTDSTFRVGFSESVTANALVSPAPKDDGKAE